MAGAKSTWRSTEAGLQRYGGTEVLEIRLHYTTLRSYTWSFRCHWPLVPPNRTQQSMSNGRMRSSAWLDACGAAPDTIHQMTGKAVDISGAAVNLDYTYKPQIKPGDILDLPQTY